MALPKPKPSKAVQQKLKVEKAAVYAKNKERVLKHLQKRGLRNQAIAAIMANIDVETSGSFDYKQKQTKSGKPSDPRTIKGGGVGLFQFDDYQKNVGNESWYKEYLKDSGKKDSAESQIDYILDSVFAKNKNDIGWKSKLKIGKGDLEVLEQYLNTTENARDIADAFEDRFENAGIPHSDKRRNKTDQYLSELEPAKDKLDTFPPERVFDVEKEKSMFEKVRPYIPVVRHLNEGGAIPMDRQMSMFDDGGLEDDGGTVDPVSGNDVPPGSSQEEVRDDIPAQLSEGEFVFPADVVRYIGLEKLMQMRQEAKMGLKMMDEMGQMGNSEEATMPDNLPFDINDLDMDDEIDDNTQNFNVGGMPMPNQQAGVFFTPGTSGIATSPVQAASAQYQPDIAEPARPQQAPVPTYQPKEIPEYTPFIGGGAPNVEQETRQFINDEGNIINVIYNKATGEPLNEAEKAKITEGYKPYDPNAPKVEDTTVTPTTPQTTSVRMEDADSQSRDEARRKEEEEKFGPGGGRISVGGTTYGVSFDFKDPVLGGVGAIAKAFQNELKPGDFATLQEPLYKVDPKNPLQPEFIGVNKFKVNATEYNAIKAAIDEFGANSKQAQNAIANAEVKGQARAGALDSVAELKRTLPAFNRSKEMKNAIEEYEKYIEQEIDKLDDDTQQSNLVTRIKDRNQRSKTPVAGKPGSLINPFEAPGGRVLGDRGRPDVEFTPPKPERTINIGPDDRGDDPRDNLNTGASNKPDDRDRPPSGAFFKDGGLASKPKPKAKKMKRGGLASKK